MQFSKSALIEMLAARKALRAHGFSTLLASPLSNPKVAKNGKLGVLTAPMHLAPYTLGGFNVCPKATAGCIAACLHTAGNPAYMAGKSRARIARTKAYATDRKNFMLSLVAEIMLHVRRADRENMAPAVRLNATSDVRWEAMPVTIAGVTYANVMEIFPDVTFYDYTKIANRKKIPSNYVLTFSLAENNDSYARIAHENGMNVAAVFSTKRNKPLPATYTIDGLTLPVINGDEHDYRPADPRGVIVGLTAKGKAIGDTSGFVRIV